ncbi:MAG: hypothetical protein WCK63_10920 [Betaproteobacteria bacterium]
MILLLKLLLTPLLIVSLTLTGRRWGLMASGFLIGMPVVSAPVSFILACEFGPGFAQHAAVGSMAGQISNCIFCLTYSLLARKSSWLLSAIAAIVAFLIMTWLLDQLDWQLLPAFFALLIVIAVVTRLIPRQNSLIKSIPTPRWDLTARIVTSTCFVILLTTMADHLGAQLSGLISPFPVFSVVFASFTHSQSGPLAAANLLRGVVWGSGAYAAFFLIVATLISPLGIPLTYLLALLLSMIVGGLSFIVERKTQRAGGGT